MMNFNLYIWKRKRDNMDNYPQIEQLFEKEAYLIDIFPKTVPSKTDNRYFRVEDIFQKNRSEFDSNVTKLILKLYCYYDIIPVLGDGTECDIAPDELLKLMKRCLDGEIELINFFLPE